MRPTRDGFACPHCPLFTLLVGVVRVTSYLALLHFNRSVTEKQTGLQAPDFLRRPSGPC